MEQPRSSRCWECGKELGKKKGGGYHWVEKLIDGHSRILHNSCGNRVAKRRAFSSAMPDEPCSTKRVGGWRASWNDNLEE